MKEVFDYFREISKIPRGSKNTQGISEYIVDFALKNKLEYYSDEFGNVIINKPASVGFEKSLGVVLQGHLDMVCVKDKNSSHDFSSDPIKLIENEDYITADKTTLGADNGIAAAMMLALLSSESYPHPALEAVFTVDEEIGLLGAKALNFDKLLYKTVINLDSEDEGVFTVSCAGGEIVNLSVPLKSIKSVGDFYKITVNGLRGGHSGVDIDKNRANALLLVGRLLCRLNKKQNINISEIYGGIKDNAIPCEAELILAAQDEELLYSDIDEFKKLVKNEYKKSDPDIEITCERTKRCEFVLDESSKNTVLFLMRNLPNGIISMSEDIKGLPEASLNFATVAVTDDSLKASFGVRGSVESKIDDIADKLYYYAKIFGGSTKISGDYPAWEYNENSLIREIAIYSYRRLFNKEPKIEAIHAGLECGVFSRNIKDCDCISIGPDIMGAHTTSESLSVSSTQRTFLLLTEILKNLK